MKTSQLKAISAKFKTNNNLPILDSILIKNNKGIITDLESTIVIENFGVKSDTPICIDRKELLSVLESLPDAKVTTGDNFGLLFTQGNDTITLQGDDYNDFPTKVLSSTDEYVFTGNVTPELFKQLETAVKFVSKDELRPAMTTVYVYDKIVSTDAHKMYFEPVAEPLDKQILVTPKTVQLLKICGADKTYFSIAISKEYLSFTSADIIIYQRIIDERYPNFQAVIPTKNDIICEFDVKMLTDKLKTAVKFGNVTTHQVNIHFNGKIGIKSVYIDFSREYSSSIDYLDMVGEIEIGFNGNFLLELLANCDKTAMIEMSEPNRAAIIDGKYLIMPVMLKNY